MEKTIGRQLSSLRVASKHETAEDRWQGMMADVRRWFNGSLDFGFPKAHPAPPLNGWTWQRRF